MRLYHALRLDVGVALLGYLTFGWRGLALGLVLRGLTTSLYNQAVGFIATLTLTPSGEPAPSPEE